MNAKLSLTHPVMSPSVAIAINGDSAFASHLLTPIQPVIVVIGENVTFNTLTLVVPT